MSIAFGILDQCLSTVVVQARLWSHVYGLHPERSALGFAFDIDQCGSQQIIECVSKRCASRAAFAFNTIRYIFFKRYGSADELED